MTNNLYIAAITCLVLTACHPTPTGGVLRFLGIHAILMSTPNLPEPNGPFPPPHEPEHPHFL